MATKSRLRDEQCYIDAKNEDSLKPLKYILQDYYALPSGNLTRGINWQDGFGIPKQRIDADTYLRDRRLTKYGNQSLELGPLPLPTTPGKLYGQGNTDIESLIRPGINDRTLNSCLPKETEFYKRSFAIFDHLPVVPNGCVDNVVQKSNDYRQGISTRLGNRTQVNKN